VTAECATLNSYQPRDGTVVRKLIILDLSSTDAFHLLALAAAILALGAVYWLVRDQGQPREIIAAGDG
jgi:hypothetical protein